MNKTSYTFAWKFLYGFVFVVVVPVLLALWAIATEPAVRLNRIESMPLGIGLAVSGLLLLVLGMLGLVIHGKGLPMNAFPPRLYVHQGIYRLIPHPIYVGFILCCFGTAILCQSRSGFWLVAPIAALGCVVIVEGFEKHDLIERFGKQVQRCLISLPKDEDRRPFLLERVSVYVLVLVPWVVLYEAFVALGVPPDAIVAYLPFEHHLPTLEWTEVLYAGTYVLVVLVPLVVTTARTLREFSIAGLIATFIMVLLFISFPLIAPPREFTPQGSFGRLLLFERKYDTSAAAFPSYHVVWAIIAARAFAKTFPRSKLLWWSLAILITMSCVTTGMHAIVDVVAGVAAGFMFLQYKSMWEWIRSLSERIANSWKEWHVGRVRIINHGAYTGAGAGIGVLIVGTLLGSGSVGYVLLIAFSSLIMAGLWAQVIEGSSSLLRPYGYYGGVIGVILGAGVANLLGGNAWLLLGAYAVAAPAIQGLGRLRCLVQGCCHGREAPAHVGIRHTHIRSRVCRLTNLASVPLHPTPVYSILWNVVLGIVLLRLWSLHVEPTMIAGLYLVLNGLGRFVEEAYRGEPQTPILGKLRLYQLMAVLSVVAGASLTTVRSAAITSGFGVNSATVIAAVAFGLITWFAQGVDFPNSNKRFARLV